MGNNKFTIGGAVCAVILLIIGAYFLLRPDFKVHSNQTPESIRGGISEGSYYSPDPRELKILKVTVRSHHRGEIKNTDFGVSYKIIETGAWKTESCQGFCPVDDPNGNGMLWFFGDSEHTVTMNKKMAKFMHLVFLIPIPIQEVTLLFKGKPVGQVYIKQ